MRVVLIAFAVSVVVLAAPAVALAHPGQARTDAEHIAEDTAPHDLAAESQMTRHTRAATAGDARAAAASLAAADHEVGRWGPLVNWPVVGVHVALLPNGKVLAYDSVGDAATETFPVHNFTRATVWDPETGTHTNVNVTGYNVFCSGLAHLTDGSLFLAGGNRSSALDGIVQTHVFNYLTNTWSLGPNMAAGRWYPTVTPLRNGEMLITEGGPDIPEVRTTAGSLRRLTSASLNLPLYPWIHAAPDGRAFYAGPNQTMRALNTDGTGAWQSLGQRDAVNRDYGSHALYDIGRILVAGGGASSADVRTININGATPQVTATAPMANGRRQHNLTVLADGSVLATGGNSSGAGLVDLQNGVYAGELWTPTAGNPATGIWRTLAAETATRQYHSTALLLPDGRVLSSGGGICGTCDQVNYLAKNAQVFTPPYLFKADGSGDLAPRPAIASAPGTVAYGAGFQIETPDAAAIRKVALVRLGAVTHSVNMEQRYVPLTFSASAGALTATAPANANIAPPGVYMLFIVDAAGVPSVAKMVTVSATAPDTSPPTAPASLTATAAGSSQVNLSWAAATDNVGVTGYRVERCQGPGCTNFTEIAPPTGTTHSDTGLSGSTTYRYRVRAADAAGNLGGYSTEAQATTSAAPSTPPGLVGGWAFSEGFGSTTADASGNGNVGTITNATWSTQGRYGNALSFNGANSVVRVPSSASLNVTTGMTLSGWVRPTGSQSGWRTIVQRQADAYFLTASSESPRRPAGGGTIGGITQHVTGPTAITVNAWTHVALTFDGANLRLYVNGVQAATRAVGGTVQTTTNPLWIGGNQPYGEYFQGLIDEVRVYNRALTAADIQADMNTSIVPTAPDTTPPSTPSGVSASPTSATQITLTWTASTDNVGITGYQVERCAGATCTNFTQIGTPTGTTFNDTGLSPSTTYRYQVRAADQAGNLSPYSTIASATTPAAADTTPPSTPSGLTATAASATQINVSWTASTDNVGVTGYQVERCAGATCTNFTQIGAPITTTFNDADLSASTTYRYRVRAADQAGNLSPYSTIASATTPAVPDTTPPSAPTGLTATAISTTRIDLAWTASTDNVGVTSYQVERCQGATCTDFAQVGTPTATSFSNTGLAANTTYSFRVLAVDAVGNPSPYSEIVTRQTPAPDTTPPSATMTAPASGSTVSGNVTVSAGANDDVGVAGVQFLLDGANLGAEDSTVPYSMTWDTTSASNGVHTLEARVRDAAGNSALSSNSVTVTVSNAAPPPPSGLVGAWGFGEGSGATTADTSGNGNTATLVNGPTWVAGKYGSGLSFDGANDHLSMANSSSLDISGSAITVSMWINPATISGDSVLLGKFWNAGMTSPYYQYGVELSGGRPHFYIGTSTGAVGASMDSALALNQWSHLAIVFNGSQTLFYVNGTLVNSKLLNATMTARGGLLRVGADADPWQFYRGVLDNLRIYNRTLTASEVQSDMDAAVGPETMLGAASVLLT